MLHDVFSRWYYLPHPSYKPVANEDKLRRTSCHTCHKLQWPQCTVACHCFFAWPPKYSPVDLRVIYSTTPTIILVVESTSLLFFYTFWVDRLLYVVATSNSIIIHTSSSQLLALIALDNFVLIAVYYVKKIEAL